VITPVIRISVGPERRPQVSGAGIAKSWRRHADNLQRGPVHRDLLPDRGLGAAEVRQCPLISHDGDLAVTVGQQASRRRRLAEDRKEVDRDVSGVGKRGAVSDGDRRIIGTTGISAVIHRHLLEHVVLRPPVEKVGARHALAGASGVGPQRFDRDDAAGVGVGERPQQDRIDHRENGDGGADGQGKYGAGAKCETPAPGQAPPGMAHVAEQRIERSPYPRVSHGFLHLRHAAELEAGLSPRLGLAPSLLDQVRDAAVHVIAQLAIEVPFQPIAPSTEQIEKPGHG
jgi:hypothetical protein